MMRYSVQPRDRIFVKDHGISSFVNNMGKDTVKNTSKYLSRKYSKKLLDHTKQSATDALKFVSETAIQKTADGTTHLIGNKLLIEL